MFFFVSFMSRKKEIFVSMGRDIAIKRTIVLVHVVKKEWGGGKFRQKHFSLQDLFFLFLYLVAFMCVLILRTHSWRHYLQKRHYSFGGKNMWIHCRAHMYHIVKVSSFQTREITSKRFPTKKEKLIVINCIIPKFQDKVWKLNIISFYSHPTCYQYH